MDRLSGAVTVVEEVHGFKYFEVPDLLGFVDGTENPLGAAAEAAVAVGIEDPGFAGSSYVVVQKYLHDLAEWNALPVEQQEMVIGRTKLSNVEFPDDVKPSNSHVALNTITDPDGEERQVLRDNMPFGAAGTGTFGTYYIAYSKSPSITEEMLDRMFVGAPPGNYDRILDFSTAVTGTLFCSHRRPPGESTPATRRSRGRRGTRTHRGHLRRDYRPVARIAGHRWAARRGASASGPNHPTGGGV